jgi:hypothetical protein
MKGAAGFTPQRHQCRDVVTVSRYAQAQGSSKSEDHQIAIVEIAICVGAQLGHISNE